ncbi:DNA-3-methyladenine glycosylase family protein [Wenzhouxiangella marina]|uniref:DNA-3-methyladenine glycosylase II n=1 Tax=Wenzhouxiangella marina TaxID=1579979 RepID=A0A0K0XZA1_9GAMM|nr:DNA-3-methyladenine glycosylase [Wenzhouxiangella marina]AKS43018.1 HhH-GPD [Wenzhouxiangella marina]MBB6087299.1 DNA-3-methyladenine glycosylase II [Wenzhouxiangella marina]
MRTRETAQDFQLTRAHLESALDEIARRDPHIAKALEAVGYPEERRRGGPSFEHFLRIIVGQQLSVKAAATIFGRVETALDGDFQPERILAMNDEELRAMGLSRQKIGYARSLSEAVLDGQLNPAELASLPDEEIVERITRVKGFGRWSAEMFLLFSLGRPDVWPADDLAIQAGLHRLKGLPERPNRKETDALGEAWRPYRGAVAVFIWHYYSNAPLP